VKYRPKTAVRGHMQRRMHFDPGWYQFLTERVAGCTAGGQRIGRPAGRKVAGEFVYS